jgi:endoglucanase
MVKSVAAHVRGRLQAGRVEHEGVPLIPPFEIFGVTPPFYVGSALVGAVATYPTGGSLLRNRRRSIARLGVPLLIALSGALWISPTASPQAGTRMTVNRWLSPRPAPETPGFLHADGGHILDENNQPVRLTGLNWFGLETTNYCPHGLWVRSMTLFLDQIRGLGYNCLRVPYCNQMFDPGSVPNGIDFHQDPDLMGKSGVEILDLLVQRAGERGMKIILDRHRPDSGGQSALWYTPQYSEARWISDWVALAKRYKANPTVIGCDLHNEPHNPATWGDGNAMTDWRLAAERAGSAILAVNPNLLIIVEGIEQAGGASYWWGGNLRNARTNPVRLRYSDQLVYSIHDYPASVHDQSWFHDPTYPANLAPLWDVTWGYLIKNQVAPVLIGEFGTKNVTEVDQKWFHTLAGYIMHTGASFTYWSWNPNSGDTGGILNDDWKTIHRDKQKVLQPLLAPQFPPFGDTFW